MENKKIRICHFTSAHDAHDDRIYLKECISLKNAGYEVFLAARGESASDEGIRIAGCGMPGNRLDRMFLFSRKIYEKALETDADIYHFHDPELLPYALKIKRKGRKVIFDSHEDVPAQILDKDWIPFFLRRIISRLYKMYETHAVKKIDAVIAATPHIAEQFKGRTKKVEVINNYPKLDDIIFHDTPFQQRDSIVCYAGGISEQRGEKVMIEAMKDLDATLILAGEHKELRTERVIYPGKLNREQINELYGRSVVGLVTLLPTVCYIYSLPVKMFEYMSAGLPFVASDFPLWKRIVEENGCGICVDCEKADEVRAAIRQLLDDPCKAQEMGKAGRKAVESKYNWNIEEQKLISLYQDLLDIERDSYAD